MREGIAVAALRRIDEASNPIALRQIFQTFNDSFDQKPIRSAFAGRLDMMLLKCIDEIDRGILKDIKSDFDEKITTVMTNKALQFPNVEIPKKPKKKKIKPEKDLSEKDIEMLGVIKKDNKYSKFKDSDIYGSLNPDYLDLGFKVEFDLKEGALKDQIEKQAIEYLLGLFRGNKTKVAKVYGVTSKTLYNKMKDLQL